MTASNIRKEALESSQKMGIDGKSCSKEQKIIPTTNKSTLTKVNILSSELPSVLENHSEPYSSGSEPFHVFKDWRQKQELLNGPACLVLKLRVYIITLTASVYSLSPKLTSIQASKNQEQVLKNDIIYSMLKIYYYSLANPGGLMFLN